MGIVSTHDILLEAVYGMVANVRHSRWTMDNDMNCGNIFKFDIVDMMVSLDSPWRVS